MKCIIWVCRFLFFLNFKNGGGGVNFGEEFYGESESEKKIFFNDVLLKCDQLKVKYFNFKKIKFFKFLINLIFFMMNSTFNINPPVFEIKIKIKIDTL